MLGSLVEGHLMLVLAALLRESADTLMDPFVAVDLGSPVRIGWRRGSDDGINVGLERDGRV